MKLDLKKLEDKLDSALEAETTESLNEWLDTKRTMKKWNIELTEEQLSMIAEALEFTSRFHCGQIGVSYLPSETQKLLWDSNDWELSQKRRDQFESIGALMKSVMHKDMDARTHSSYGVGFSEYSDNLYDMYKMIRYKQHIEQQKETEEDLSYSVHSYYSKYGNKDDIKVEKVKNKS